MKVYAIIDSIYRNFEHAAKVKYDAMEISYLEYLTAKKKSRQIVEDKLQATDDY